MTVHVLHLSDVHAAAHPGAVVYGQDADGNLRRVVDAAHARRASFDAVVVTGDVADDASPAAYRRVHTFLQPLAGVFRWVPGNHDERDRMAEVDRDALTSATVGPWRLVTFDSRWPGRVAGTATPAAIEHLDAELDSAGGAPCAVMLHHPPRPPCTHPDCQTKGRQHFLEVLDRHADVRAVLSGHMHHSFSMTRGHACWVGAPSTCVQVDHPGHGYTADRPGAHLVELGDDGSVLVSPVHA